MSLFTPFYREQEPTERRPSGSADPQEELRALRAEIDFLRGQLSRARATASVQSPAEVTEKIVPEKPPVDTKMD